MILTHDQIQRRQKELRITVDTRIGLVPRPGEPGRNMLSPEGSLRYLASLGVPPASMPDAPLEDYVSETAAAALEKLSLDGVDPKWDGYYFCGDTPQKRRKLTAAAAYVAHRFIRKGRLVSWVTSTDLVSLDEQAMHKGNTDDDIDIRFQAESDQFDVRAVYHLLVITDVKLRDTTAFMDRAVTTVIGDRAARGLPTLVVLSSTQDVPMMKEYPIGRCLLNHFAAIGLD